MLEGISNTLKYIYLQTHPRFCNVGIAIILNFCAMSAFLAKTSHTLRKSLCLSASQHGRSCFETSPTPPIDLPFLSHKDKGGVTGGLWEVYGRSDGRCQIRKTPLNKGLSLKNGRSDGTTQKSHPKVAISAS